MSVLEATYQVWKDTGFKDKDMQRAFERRINVKSVSALIKKLGEHDVVSHTKFHGVPTEPGYYVWWQKGDDAPHPTVAKVMRYEDYKPLGENPLKYKDVKQDSLLVRWCVDDIDQVSMTCSIQPRVWLKVGELN